MFLSNTLYYILLVSNLTYLQGSNTQEETYPKEFIENREFFDFQLTGKHFIGFKALIGAINCIESIPNGYKAYRNINLYEIHNNSENIVNILRDSKTRTTDDITKRLTGKYSKNLEHVATIVASICKFFLEDTISYFIFRSTTVKTVDDYMKEAIEGLQKIPKAFCRQRSTITASGFNEMVLEVIAHSMVLEVIAHIIKISREAQGANVANGMKVANKFFENIIGKIPLFATKYPYLAESYEMEKHFRNYLAIQITAYGCSDGTMLPRLADYVLKCEKCETHDPNEIKGPPQFNMDYNSISTEDKHIDAIFLLTKYVDTDEMKREYLMNPGRILSRSLTRSIWFVKWMFSILAYHIDFTNMIKFSNGRDVTAFFLNLLQKSKLDYCFIGAIINYFSLLHKYYKMYNELCAQWEAMDTKGRLDSYYSYNAKEFAVNPYQYNVGPKKRKPIDAVYKEYKKRRSYIVKEYIMNTLTSDRHDEHRTNPDKTGEEREETKILEGFEKLWVRWGRRERWGNLNALDFWKTDTKETLDFLVKVLVEFDDKKALDFWKGYTTAQDSTDSSAGVAKPKSSGRFVALDDRVQSAANGSERKLVPELEEEGEDESGAELSNKV